MQAVNLTDKLEFKHSPSLKLVTDSDNLGPTDTNLIMQAAISLKEISNFKSGAFISLNKKIPISAGLGGGSSDAAAALIGLNLLWNTNLSFNELCNLGSKLGSDVPFFFHGGTAIATKKGEELSRLPTPYEKWALLIENQKEVISAKTHKMYSFLKPEHYSLNNEATEEIKRLLFNYKPIFANTFNTFDTVAPLMYQNYHEIKKLAMKIGIHNLTLAGSGPSFFSLFNDHSQGISIQDELLRHGVKSHLVNLLEPENVDLSTGPSNLVSFV